MVSHPIITLKAFFHALTHTLVYQEHPELGKFEFCYWAEFGIGPKDQSGFHKRRLFGGQICNVFYVPKGTDDGYKIPAYVCTPEFIHILFHAPDPASIIQVLRSVEDLNDIKAPWSWSSRIYVFFTTFYLMMAAAYTVGMIHNGDLSFWSFILLGIYLLVAFLFYKWTQASRREDLIKAQRELKKATEHERIDHPYTD